MSNCVLKDDGTSVRFGALKPGFNPSDIRH